jgi:hypothetical protein
MRSLSKSKLMAYRQCPRRLWLEVHKPELREDDDATKASFQVGHRVGDIARKLYDPQENGVLIDIQQEGFEAAFAKTQVLMRTKQPIFEAAFTAKGALALSDVLLPVQKGWRMVEVKSSTSVKDYYYEDVAVQAFVARAAGAPLRSVALAHIDSFWVYPGNENYRGLLKETDLTEEAFSREKVVQSWIREAQIVVSGDEPEMPTGDQCDTPFPCGFYGFCSSQEPKAEYPIQWLPRLKAKPYLEQGVLDMREMPEDAKLSIAQQRVKECTITGKHWFDAAGAAADLSNYPLPGYFLDFETIQFAVPIWKDTRPYQQIPFQFSVHRLGMRGKLEHDRFLDLSGNDSSRAFAEKLIVCCGDKDPIFVYNAGFEKSRIAELAERFPKLAKRLNNINERIVDLLPIARNRYYHPSQQGSWSIKAVLPAVVPELSYDGLDGVQNGGDAQNAFLEAIHPETDPARKQEIERQLLDYCRLDTYAMVRLWQVFAGRTNWSL